MVATDVRHKIWEEIQRVVITFLGTSFPLIFLAESSVDGALDTGSMGGPSSMTIALENTKQSTTCSQPWGKSQFWIKSHTESLFAGTFAIGVEGRTSGESSSSTIGLDFTILPRRRVG